MNRDILDKILNTKISPIKLSEALRGEYFPEIVKIFNQDDSRKRFGLYQGELIPVNERNLTDVRTRMGVLIEFELARISNELLRLNEIDDVFWCYVVANRFPDLEVRNNSGDRMLRLEIKSLQCIAEEKAANFDTLLKDIDKNTDYVVVCLWDWFRDKGVCCKWDAVPKIVKVYVFHAYSLALLRDTHWLNSPPPDLGGGYQGFDIRYAVTCKNGVYSKEQGNYGKLMRIWKEGFQFRPKETDELLDTEREYLKFQKEIIFEGFKLLATQQLSEISPSNSAAELEGNICEVFFKGRMIGYKSSSTLYILRSLLPPRTNILALCEKNHASFIVVMTDKYKSSIFHCSDGFNNLIAGDIKPKEVIKKLSHS